MNGPDERVDAWLRADIEPLAPPPGAYERIRRRARRRKTLRVVTSAAGAAAAAAAVLAGPGVVSGVTSHARPAAPVSAGTGAGLQQREPSPSQTNRQLQPQVSALSAAGSAAGVPHNFQPTSVTFVGPHVGAVIGQAGTPGHCATSYCTSLAGTSDYGATWYGVSAPVTGPPDGSAGVSQIRFLTVRDGWAFGPALWVTQDGGAHWAPENTSGLRVTGLETAGNRAFALLADCTGSDAAYASQCTAFSLYSSPAGSSQWTQVPGATARLPSAAGQPGSASLVLTPSRGYLLAPSGALLAGPLTGAAWSIANPAAPCAPGPPGSQGQPTAGLLTGNSSRLVLVCTTPAPGVDAQLKSVFTSADGGTTWSAAAGSAPATGLATTVATGGDGLLLLATDAGIYRSSDTGGTWQQVLASPAGAASGQTGFSYVGMTSAAAGVALPADPGLHEVFTTGDGGQTWQRRSVSPP